MPTLADTGFGLGLPPSSHAVPRDVIAMTQRPTLILGEFQVLQRVLVFVRLGVQLCLTRSMLMISPIVLATLRLLELPKPVNRRLDLQSTASPIPILSMRSESHILLAQHA
jgi:hypothetical protein